MFFLSLFFILYLLLLSNVEWNSFRKEINKQILPGKETNNLGKKNTGKTGQLLGFLGLASSLLILFSSSSFHEILIVGICSEYSVPDSKGAGVISVVRHRRVYFYKKTKKKKKKERLINLGNAV